MLLGLMTILLFGGFIGDIKYELQSDYVRLSGHLQIQHKDYFRLGSGNPSAYGIARYEKILDIVRHDAVLAPMLVIATPMLQFGAIAGNYGASVSSTVYVRGMVVEDQNRMLEWNDYALPMRSRRLSLSGTAPDTAVIGTGVARVLQLCAALKMPDCDPVGAKDDVAGAALPDDIAALTNTGKSLAAVASGEEAPRIEILAANARGAPNVAAVSVLRAEFQGIKERDDVHVGLHLSQAQKLVFGVSTPQVTAIELQLHHTSQIAAARERLEGLLTTTLRGEPLGIVDYETLNPFYGQTLGMFAAIFGFISALIGAIVLFTVTNTMSMAVIERTAEIGTLRAIGLRRGGVRTMFISEGIILGCFGAVLGIAASLGMAWMIDHLGINWTPPGAVEPVLLAVRLTGENEMMLVGSVSLVVVAGLSALLPAARASRMNIVDALRHV